jgi:hypothetical protein
MLCAVGEAVVCGQPLARTRGLFGLLSTTCRSPVDGTVAAVSSHTGRVLLEEPGNDIEVRAFLPGIVSARLDDRGVAVSGWAARVAGVFGVGGEGSGPLVAAVGRRDAILEAASIADLHAGAVLLGGALVTREALERATAVGVVGIITGGVHDAALAGWLGQDLTLADSTSLSAPLTLVVVGGFGRVALEAEADRLLRAHLGRPACLSGLTRVRAGARRPEVLVPLDTEPGEATAASPPPRLQIGSLVQVVRSPWFGWHGRVGALPAELQAVESGAVCQVAHVDLSDGRTVVVACANLEVLADPPTEEPSP